MNKFLNRLGINFEKKYVVYRKGEENIWFFDEPVYDKKQAIERMNISNKNNNCSYIKTRYIIEL